MEKLFCALIVVLPACAPRLIPGTEVEATDENQRILDVVEQYRRGAEARNVDAVMGLVSSSFYDDAGTPDASDDLDAQGLRKRLSAEWEKRVKQLRLELQVKKIFVEGDTARVRYFYTLRYELGEAWKQELDTKEMLLKRVGGAWKILAGV